MTNNEELIAKVREKIKLAESIRELGGFDALNVWREIATELAPKLADALEAATRVPVQGEPNGDRENTA